MTSKVNPVRETQIQHYKPLYEELCRLGSPPLVLSPFDKKPAFGSVRASLALDAEEACEMLRDGFNLGRVAYLGSLPGHNPFGIEVLDLDSADHGLDLSPFSGLMTRRSGELVRHHLWFRRTNPTSPRKGARQSSKMISNGAYDLMPWNTVLPGSIHPNGSLYELFLWRDGQWELWDGQEPLELLHRLPVVDPEPYRPMRRGITDNLESSASDNRPFLIHPGTLADREYAARNYVRGLIRMGIVSRSGRGGRSTLAKVVSHLMAYLCLPMETALKYLTEPLYEQGWSKQANRVEPGRDPRVVEDKSASLWNTKSWNSCCTDAATGALFPWSQEELIEALEWGITSIPAYGVIRWEQVARKEHAKACLKHFIAFLKGLGELPVCEASVAAEALYQAFLPLYGLAEVDCTKHRFCVAMATAIKAEVVPFRRFTRTAAHTSHYKGLSLMGLEDAFSYWIGDHPLPPLPEALKKTSPASSAA